MLELETIVIEHPDIPGEPMIINKSDFKTEIHKIFKPKKPKAAETESDPDGESGEKTPAPETEPAKSKGRKKPAAAE